MARVSAAGRATVGGESRLRATRYNQVIGLSRASSSGTSATADRQFPEIDPDDPRTRLRRLRNPVNHTAMRIEQREKWLSNLDS